ncbi:MAG: hypothetical protein A2017_07695 [Lentisphaerae bacterium GWF2_44_16]|nr:MAG: hypothetical protein A2017_07695 [Lentisphaerae bacterium GWF2_44_16]
MKIDIKTGRVEFEASSSKTLDILFAGDLCPRDRTENLILEGRSEEIVAGVVKELRNCDLSVVNLETPLTASGYPIPKSGPNIRVAPECIQLLKACGWDIACCANNHIGDFGDAPVTETLSRLDENGILHVGAGENLKSAYQPLFVEKNGVKIAFLAFAENEFGSAGESKPGAAPLNPLRNIAQIKETSKLADITIVMVHGGNELNPVPSPRVVDTYRAFADAGASAVVAGHTHCPQGIELWNGIPIVYSLSNFIFDATAEYEGYNWWYGYMLRLKFSGTRATGLQVIPHHCMPHGEKVTLLEGSAREDFIKYLNFISEIIKSPDEVRKYYNAWCARSIDGGYFSRLGKAFYPINWEDKTSIGAFMAMRNLHTCEAHNELLTNSLRLIEEHAVEDALKYLPRLNSLIQGKLPC